jgi:hypothetical protein
MMDNGIIKMKNPSINREDYINLLLIPVDSKDKKVSISFAEL